MKTKLIQLVLPILLLLPFLAHAQFWAESLGGNDVDEVLDLCRDNSGNIIGAGYFTNSASFGQNITLVSASMGVPDIFIQKSGPAGNILWAVRAGGSGSDRALSVKTDNSGNIYITGFYFGAAQFGSFTLNSTSGSKEIFIAKLDGSGNFQWATSAGGSLADIGNAIDLDASGNIFVTGQFEGTATFGSASFTSINNPQTGQPSIDVFISKLDNNGNFIWSKQGAAEFTDRGMDIAVDNAGNAFICGQFSDTIQFATTYFNPVMNAVFLMKVDANGNELFFRRASGTYSMAYAVKIDNSQNVYITGDYQGTLAFYGSTNNFISDNYSQGVFLAKYSNSGSFIWASSSSSNNAISSRDLALDLNGDPYILGEFRCTLNDYADNYGQGTFNSVGFRDIFTTKFSSSGQYLWSRNFGGPSDDQAHGIFLAAVDKPTIAGSYEKHMAWPVNSLSIVSNYMNTAYNPNWSNVPYCNDASYGNYDGIRAEGYSDGFIAMAIDINRQPYDYYHRNGSTCLRPFVSGCIEPAISYLCADTLTFCGSGTLVANTWTFSGLNGSIGPDYHFQWSTSMNDTLYSKNITTTNSYNVTMTTLDGCYTSADTVYAIVNPVPAAPTISDDAIVNTNHPRFALPIHVCFPDTVLLSAANYLPGDTVKWHTGSGPGGPLYVANDSAAVYTTGNYNVVVTNQYGCTNYNNVQLFLDSALLTIAPKSLIPDSAVICLGQPFRFWMYDTINNPSASLNYSLLYISNNWSSTPALNIVSNNTQMTGWCYPNISGMYHLTNTIYYTNTCGTDTFVVQDSIYINVHPVPQLYLSVTGPNFLCPGDTAVIVVTGTPSTPANTIWTILPNDTIFAAVPANYYFSSLITDTVTGCSSPSSLNYNLQPKPNPVISMSPASGLICPNDSVLLTVNTPGTNYTWIGPTGILPYNTQSIYDSLPGFYHCIITDNDGCVLTSNTAELKQYNTPYLLALPGNVVCLNQNNNITLQVITNDSTLIQWLAPLSGGGTQQVVTQSGTYSCNVTMCGITTLCSIIVVVSQAVAQITGAGMICPNDSVWLYANSGMIGYAWSPIISNVDSVFVSAGTYTLTTTDNNGCTATTNFTITSDTSVAQPTAGNVTICSGSAATLNATAAGSLNWYTSPLGGNPIATGTSFVTPSLSANTTYYVETSDSTGCSSLRTPVTVTIDPASIAPVMYANDSICIGSTIMLGTTYVANATYAWTGPNGFSSSSQNPFINNSTLANSGYYYLQLQSPNCTSPLDSVYISIMNPSIAGISGNQTVCEGTYASFVILNPDPGATFTWTGPNNFTASGDSLTFTSADTLQNGIYIVTETLGACQGISDTILFTVLAAPLPANIYSNSPVCEHDTLFLFADTLQGNAGYLWNGFSNSFTSTQQNPIIPNVDMSYTDSYMLWTIGTNGCTSIMPTWLSVFVNGLPQTSLGPDTTICTSTPITLQPTGNFPSYLWQDNSTTNFLIVDSTQMYWVAVTDSNGCVGGDSVLVTAINCRVQAPNIFTPNADGTNDYFSFIGQHLKSAECEIFNRYGTLVYRWDDPNGKWDGTSIQTRQPVNEGVYYFVAHVENYEGVPMEFKGFIQLVR